MSLQSLSALHWAGQWMGRGRTVFREVFGEQRAWGRMGFLLVIKGKRTDLTLPGGWQDEPKHPQFLLLPCWERSSSGEPGAQLSPIWERPPQLQQLLKRGLSHQPVTKSQPSKPSQPQEANPAIAAFRICQQGKVLCRGKGIQSPN